MSELTDPISQPASSPSQINGRPNPAANSASTQRLIEPKDSNRELLETVVFVVFLVLLLKAFVAEAFVIPTGSMATTLLGDHVRVTCEKCKYEYVVNAQQDSRPVPSVTGSCPNCRHEREIRPVIQGLLGLIFSPDPDRLRGGDKVLVYKPRYDYARPDRHDVIVFKFPGHPRASENQETNGVTRWREGGPQKDYIAHNYIKRLWGLPGDRLAIWYGDVHARLGKGNEERLEILRRSPAKYESMRRIVHHNDYLDPALPRRWQDEAKAGWQADDTGKAFQLESVDHWAWLSYRNLLRADPAFGGAQAPPAARPQLITDFLEYNSKDQPNSQSHNWTPDLMVELEVKVDAASGQFVVELVGGVDVHQAIFELSAGECTLQTLRDGQPLAYTDEQGKALPADKAKANTKMNRTGKHTVRLCSFDQRLTLWVDGTLIFSDGLCFPAPRDEERGPRLADLRPVRVGAQRAKLKVSTLQVYRDIYYTRTSGSPDVMNDVGLSLAVEEENRLVTAEDARLSAEEQKSSPETRARLIAHRVRPENWSVYYFRGGADARQRMEGPHHYPIVDKLIHPEEFLGPDEYFALGDNSTQSSDSRYWGPVPERLLLGRAVSVYFPFGRLGLIR